MNRDYSEYSRNLSSAENSLVFYVSIMLVPVSIVATYFITLFLDRYCAGGVSYATGLHNNESRYVEGGVVARDAGLFGITTEERKLVVQQFLKSQGLCHLFCEKKEGNEPPKSDVASETEATEDDNAGKGVATLESKKEENTSLATPGLADTEVTCVICLMDYADSDEIVRGKHCTHMFHKSCLMEWIGETQNDFCPVCRDFFMTPTEFKEAASKCMEPARIRHLGMGYGNTSVNAAGSMFSISPLPTDSNRDSGNEV